MHLWRSAKLVVGIEMLLAIVLVSAADPYFIHCSVLAGITTSDNSQLKDTYICSINIS